MFRRLTDWFSRMFSASKEMVMLYHASPVEDFSSLIKERLDSKRNVWRKFFASAPAELRLQVLHEVLTPVPYAWEVPLSLTELDNSGSVSESIRRIQDACRALVQAGNRQLYHDVVEVLKTVRVEASTMINKWPDPELTHWRICRYPSPNYVASHPGFWALGDDYVRPTWACTGHTKSADLKKLYSRHFDDYGQLHTLEKYARYLRGIRALDIALSRTDDSDIVLKHRRAWRKLVKELRIRYQQILDKRASDRIDDDLRAAIAEFESSEDSGRL